MRFAQKGELGLGLYLPSGKLGLYRWSQPPYIRLMRPETERNISEIQQAIGLLRRHL